MEERWVLLTSIALLAAFLSANAPLRIPHVRGAYGDEPTEASLQESQIRVACAQLGLERCITPEDWRQLDGDVAQLRLGTH